MTTRDERPLAVVRGAGDIATGTGRRLVLAGFSVVMTEFAEPRCVRRTVSFGEAIYEGTIVVESVAARRAAVGELDTWPFIEAVAVVVDPDAACLATLRPAPGPLGTVRAESGHALSSRSSSFSSPPRSTLIFTVSPA